MTESDENTSADLRWFYLVAPTGRSTVKTHKHIIKPWADIESVYYLHTAPWYTHTALWPKEPPPCWRLRPLLGAPSCWQMRRNEKWTKAKDVSGGWRSQTWREKPTGCRRHSSSHNNHDHNAMIGFGENAEFQLLQDEMMMSRKHPVVCFWLTAKTFFFFMFWLFLMEAQ